MRAGQHRQPDAVGVLLHRGLDDLLRRLVQAGVDDLHAGVAQRPGDDLGPAVVPVQAGLGDDDADAAGAGHVAERTAACAVGRATGRSRCCDRRHPAAVRRLACAGQDRSSPSRGGLTVADPRPALDAPAPHGAQRGVRTRVQPGRAARRRHGGRLVARAPRRSTRWACSASRARRRAARPRSASRSTTCRRVQRGLLLGDVVAAGTPILLVHGLVDNRSVFTLLRRALRRRGFGQVLTLNYSPFTAGRPQRGRAAGRRWSSATCEATGHERVHVVGHSLGGRRRPLLRAAAWAATPASTRCARSAARTPARPPPTCCPRGSSASCAPARTLLQELAAARARLPHPLRRLLERPRPAHRPEARRRASTTPTSPPATSCCGASGTCRCPSTARVVHQIATLLAHLDEDGTTLHAGVAPIGEGRALPPRRPRRQASGAPPPPDRL